MAFVFVNKKTGDRKRIDSGVKTSVNGVPTGGTPGQILMKYRDENYASRWENPDEVALVPPKSYSGDITLTTKATDILAPSWEGKTTVTGTPSQDSPATITGVPFAATATGPDGQSRSVDLGITGYSLPDGTKDTYDGKNGDMVQRVGKLVLDGTENWNVYTTAYYINVSSSITYPSIICTHFLHTKNINAHGIYQIDLNKNLNINYDNAAGGVENFKAWLAAQAAAGTPVTVYYELAEPMAYNIKKDITAFDGQTTVTGVTSVEVIEGRVLRVADCLPYEILRVNPNLLINSDWRSIDTIINQRNLLKYTEIGYNIDRWLTYYYAGTTIELTNQGLSLTATNIFIFMQRIMPLLDAKEIFNGKQITLSFLVDGDLTTTTCALKRGTSDNPNSWGNVVGTSYAVIRANGANLSCQLYGGVGSHNIIAAKLEEGPHQTLARKVGDQWVLNAPPPDKTLELLKCQRYYNILNPFAFLNENSDGRHEMLLQFPTMRAIPRVTFISTNENSKNLVARQIKTNSVIVSVENSGQRPRAYVETVILDANL